MVLSSSEGDFASLCEPLCSLWLDFSVPQQLKPLASAAGRRPECLLHSLLKLECLMMTAKKLRLNTDGIFGWSKHLVASAPGNIGAC
jgi:hypothetical protein